MPDNKDNQKQNNQEPERDVNILRAVGDFAIIVVGYVHELIATLFKGPRDRSGTVIRERAPGFEFDEKRSDKSNKTEKDAKEDEEQKGKDKEQESNKDKAEKNKDELHEVADKILGFEEIKEIFQKVGVEAVPGSEDHVLLKDVETGKFIYAGDKPICASKEELIRSRAEMLAGALYANELTKTDPDKLTDKEKQDLMMKSVALATKTIGAFQLAVNGQAIDYAYEKGKQWILSDVSIPGKRGTERISMQISKSNRDDVVIMRNGRVFMVMSTNDLMGSSKDEFMEKFEKRYSHEMGKHKTIANHIGNLHFTIKDDVTAVAIETEKGMVNIGEYSFKDESSVEKLKNDITATGLKVVITDPNKTEEEFAYKTVDPGAAAYVIGTVSNADMKPVFKDGNYHDPISGKDINSGAFHLEKEHRTEITNITIKTPNAIHEKEELKGNLPLNREKVEKELSKIGVNIQYDKWDRMAESLSNGADVVVHKDGDKSISLTYDVESNKLSIVQDTISERVMESTNVAYMYSSESIRPEILEKAAREIGDAYRSNQSNAEIVKGYTYGSMNEVQTRHNPYEVMCAETQEAILHEKMDQIVSDPVKDKFEEPQAEHNDEQPAKDETEQGDPISKEQQEVPVETEPKEETPNEPTEKPKEEPSEFEEDYDEEYIDDAEDYSSYPDEYEEYDL